MKPRFFAVALFFFIAVAVAPRAIGAPVQGRGLTLSGSSQGPAPGQVSPPRRQDLYTRRGSAARRCTQHVPIGTEAAENLRCLLCFQGSSMSLQRARSRRPEAKAGSRNRLTL